MKNRFVFIVCVCVCEGVCVSVRLRHNAKLTTVCHNMEDICTVYFAKETHLSLILVFT